VPVTEISPGERWAKRVRWLLMLAIAFMIVLLLVDGRSGPASRFAVRSAYAEPVAAAPGFIALTLPGDGKDLRFYIIDTTKRVVCVYTLVGDKVRLVSAREYDRDMDIFDASFQVATKDGKSVINTFEGTQGVDRQTAAAYADGLQKLLDDASKRPK